jgi:hypothetical protein
MSGEQTNFGELFGLLDKVHELEVEVARLQEQKNAADTALVIAREALEHNQAVSNEWRRENIDQRALFMTQEKAQGLINSESLERRALEARVTVLERAGSAYSGSHSTLESVWVKMVAIASLIIGLFGITLHYFAK